MKVIGGRIRRNRAMITVLVAVAAIMPATICLTVMGAGMEFLPVLGFDKEGSTVNFSLADMPGFESGAWCYEDNFGKGEAELEADGSLTLTHTYQSLTAVTRFIPELGAVEVRLVVTGDAADLKNVGALNPCWQHNASDLFGNRGLYPEDFASRCFVVTVAGLTRLEETVRYVATENVVEDSRNNPPWIQDYIPIWMPYTGQRTRFHGRGTVRPVLPLLGVISRDDKWLQAWAWPKGTRLGQVWHDCLHPTPSLKECYDPKTNRIQSRGKIYFMENDPEKLLERFNRDFPAWAPESLEVEPDGKDLLVSNPGMPGNRVRISLPAFFNGDEMSGKQVRWSRRPWGTYSFHWRGGVEGREAEAFAWAHPYDDFLDISLTVTNPQGKLLTASITAVCDYSQAPGVAEKRAVATLFWERTDRKDVEDQKVFVGGQLPGIIPGGYATMRGRFYLSADGSFDLEAKEDEVRAEWRRATPYLIAPE